MDWSELPALFPDFPDPGRWLPLLQQHLALIADAEEQTRVTAVAAQDAVRRHYAESLETWRIALASKAAADPLVVDVGSGGGYPGLVIAAVAPQAQVVLVEPLQKRARLLQSIAAELELQNVEVLALRAEEAGRGGFRERAGLVTARAVAALPVLLEYTAPFAEPGGLIALPKGSGLDSELDSARHALTELACRLEDVVPMRPEISETLVVAVFRRVGPLPPRYPRRAGMPAKRPL